MFLLFLFIVSFDVLRLRADGYYAQIIPRFKPHSHQAYVDLI